MDSDDDICIEMTYDQRNKCDSCQSLIDRMGDSVYGCDFCDSLLCDNCQCTQYINYYKCDTCNIQHCHYDGLQCDYYCFNNSRSGSGCIHCGN